MKLEPEIYTLGFLASLVMLALPMIKTIPSMTAMTAQITRSIAQIFKPLYAPRLTNPISAATKELKISIDQY